MIGELKVPFVADAQLESATKDLLCRYATWKGAPVRPPINVDDIIEGYLGLDLAFADLQDMLGISDALGATFLKDKLVVVESSLEGKEGRACFTMAHEVAHWQLHRPLVEAEELALPLLPYDDLPEQPAIVCRKQHRKASAEIQADRFAARLLMPAADVRATVAALYGPKLPTWEHVQELRDKGEFDPQLHELATEIIEAGAFHNVSNEAMRYRLLDLKLVVDASAPQLSLL